MRTLGFILACGFFFVSPAFTAPAETNLPGAGTFRYDGSPVVKVAHLTLTVRGHKQSMPAATTTGEPGVTGQVARG